MSHGGSQATFYSTHIGNDASTAQTTLGFGPDHPFQDIPDIALVASSRQSVSDNNRRCIRRKLSMVRWGDIHAAVGISQKEV